MRERNLCIIALSFGLACRAIAATPEVNSLSWHSITFGQSTDVNFATNVLPDKIGINHTLLANGQPVPADGTPLVTPFSLESRGGKVGNSHDGLTLFYTRLPAGVNFQLAADITLEQFGPENGARPAGQEGAGLLVRDILGAAREPITRPGIEELPAASNMVMNSVMAKGDSLPEVALIARQGVQQPWGNTGISIMREPYQQLTAAPVRFSLRLSRSDSGFEVAYAPRDSERWIGKKIAGADRVTRLDKTGYYLGFFASRNARITVNEASLTLSEAHTQASGPYVAPAVQPRIEVMSSPVVARRDSVFQLRTNGDGRLQVELNGRPLLVNKQVSGGEVIAVPYEAASSAGSISVTFRPQNGDELRQVFPVSLVQVSNPDVLYVSLRGTPGSDGSREHPLDFASAVNLLAPGGTLWLAEGEYPASVIPASASGTKKKLKILRPMAGSVVFNGLKLDGSYWRVEDIVVTQKSFHIAGSHNHIERVKAHHADDTGIWVASPDGIGRALWASHNTIASSESWSNQDPGRKNADGFAVKMRVGEGNRLVNCYAHDNIDDGFDLFNKIEDGANGSVTIENSRSAHNGSNGFKLGGEGLPVSHVVRGNVAVENGMDGFSDNFNPGTLIIEANRALDNARFNFLFRPSPYTTPDKQGVFKDNISLRTRPGKYNDVVSGNSDDSNYYYRAGKSINNKGDVISPDDFDYKSFLISKKP